ncbi:alcohol dehydrogenase catalytic domain-containing protein [Actinomadura sp. DC4]|uniref:zinc-dependent alcohol dehydrogenase n=1 Tax=Actinomadura sp. DC4 TaxID=3055069 RepID=UPI0025B275B6|nr:alcohol dehydrogenase catalytic domain-containing protein [Actinomadura sp. DC4]MDN3356457.1 alcohol dehydrogenase catalytic domain-containing protein [Actinomadura sp. DC4]
MRALVFHGPWDLTVEDRPEPEPGPGDVLLDILTTGICGSDLHGYTGATGRRHPGQVMGHETVARVLEDRTGTHPAGGLLTVNPVLGCRRCPACDAGTPQRCPDRRVIGVQPEISAAFAERMVAPAHNVVPLPPGTPPDVGSLVEPLAVGYHAVQRAGLTAGDTVLVIGGGPIGQAAALAARRLGAAAITILELDATRRALAARLGFTAAAPADRTPLATVVVDAAGTSASLESALGRAAQGARIVLVGMGAPRVEMSAYAISTEERSLLGSFSYDEAAFRDTAAWAAGHAAELETLVDARVGLAEAPATFRALADQTLKAAKVLVSLS